MYHGLGGSDGVDPALFEAQIEMLQRLRRIVPLRAAVAALGKANAAKLASITFDDGYVDFAEYAVPVLGRHGVHATLFVPAGCLGRTNAWDAGRAAERKILDAAALRGLDASVVEIGAHGLTHRRLAGLSSDVLRIETQDARTTLEEVWGRPVRLFAYPYGQRDDFDAAAERAVEQAGFEAACSTRFGRGSRPDERFRLRRVGIEPADDLARVRLKWEGAYDWSAWKERLGAWRRRVFTT
jgi:peptidoglycan/xylan/chitin deacetylase (PgdA/CDA1 family)